MGGQIRMKAIIYTSNTGSTAEYAQLLGNELNLPVHSLQQAKNKVPAGSEIIYLGWIMAGGINIMVQLSRQKSEIFIMN